MTKYIDAEKLKTELNTRIELLENGDAHPEVMKRVEGAIQGYKAILSIIDSLQQEHSEVDLEKEVDRFLKSEESTTYENAGSYKVAVKDPKKIARHFYELGLNAR